MVDALVCGSLAFDNVMNFQGRFQEHILPAQIHVLNVSFLVPEVKRDFGGCAGNIAYNLRLLGGSVDVVATIGDDGSQYIERFDNLEIDRTLVTVVPGMLTAQAFIITDRDNNQITAFHPGAMMEAHINELPADRAAKLAIVAPDGPRAMMQHAEALHRSDVPFIFDPGQAMPSFSGDQLYFFVTRAAYIAVNDYEAAVLAEKLGMSMVEIASKVEALIVTRGSQGSLIYSGGEEIRIHAPRPKRIVDPTGCGDAYRAGLLYGITHGLNWEQTGKIASAIASVKIECQGGQNHRPSLGEIFARCPDVQPA